MRLGKEEKFKASIRTIAHSIFFANEPADSNSCTHSTNPYSKINSYPYSKINTYIRFLQLIIDSWTFVATLSSHIND